MPFTSFCRAVVARVGVLSVIGFICATGAAVAQGMPPAGGGGAAQVGTLTLQSRDVP